MRFLLLNLFLFNISVMAQELPFSSIPQSPENYTTINIINRMLQGLGFRYFWATEGLRKIDLKYRPTKNSYNTLETLQHIFTLSSTILNTTANKVSIRPTPKITNDFNELRAKTLSNIKEASIILDQYDDRKLEDLNITFEKGGKQSKFPVWNLINGPISDAIYHTGQVVSFRRTSGNPIAKGVNVFLGIKN
ncbi:MAG: hypothetical protein ACJ0P0_06405 [Flavobacteriaceae bacterium]